MRNMYTINSNIRLVHPDAIKPDSLYAAKPPEWFLGRNVKVAFQAPDSLIEHMWVAVTGIEKECLVGRLDNDPVEAVGVRIGDRVVLDTAQIEAIDYSKEEWDDELCLLSGQHDYSNAYRGKPNQANGIDVTYEEGLTPRQALTRWQKWKPE